MWVCVLVGRTCGGQWLMSGVFLNDSGPANVLLYCLALRSHSVITPVGQLYPV